MDETPEDFEKLDAAVLAESKKNPVKTVFICPQRVCLQNAIEKRRHNLSLELAFKLADFFDVTIEELFIRERHMDSVEPEAEQ